jgi:hypothetical protein
LRVRGTAISLKIHKSLCTYTIFVGKSEGNKILGRPGLGQENNIKMNVTEIRCEVVDWTQLASTVLPPADVDLLVRKSQTSLVCTQETTRKT